MKNLGGNFELLWMIFFILAISGGLLLTVMLFFLAKSMRKNDNLFYSKYFLKKKSNWTIAIDEKFNFYLKNREYLKIKDQDYIRLCDAYGRLSSLYEYLLWITFLLFLVAVIYK